MKDNKKYILDYLKRGPSDTQRIRKEFNLNSFTCRNYLYQLRLSGHIHVVEIGTGPVPTLYAIGSGKEEEKPKYIRFLKPITINNKPVQNGFETWLAGLMREAA